ncbi:MAG: 50S ribosomal protein L3 [Chloroflexi bacterium]|nr:50S ribosomal protein L3 [Chloroflexota bacterium]MBU1750919.1 50S ribosomal protein L3 [Chloroflexota bacterium]
MIKGILGRKVGMTQVFDERGLVIPVTVIEAGPCVVTQVKTADRDGYAAVQLGFGAVKRLNRPRRGHLKGLDPVRYLREFRTAPDEAAQVGDQIDVGMFEPGDKVDVVGVSKGKGFAGVVKRHHFKGGPRTHGQSDRLRAPGSLASGTTPGRVFKGKRMPGRMGGERVTVQNLEVVLADPARNLLLVRGAVPGAKDGLLIIRQAVKS